LSYVNLLPSEKLTFDSPSRTESYNLWQDRNLNIIIIIIVQPVK